MKAAEFESVAHAKRAADKKLSFFHSMVAATGKHVPPVQGQKQGTSHAAGKKPAPDK